MTLTKSHTERWRERRIIKDKEMEIEETQIHANDILSIMSDKRMCRAMSSSSPATVLKIYQSISKTKKYNNAEEKPNTHPTISYIFPINARKR